MDRPERGRSGLSRPGLGEPPGEPPRLNGHRPKLTGPPVPPSNPADEPGDPDEPIWKRHRPPFYYQPRVILTFLVVVLFVGAIALNARRDDWPPDAQCGAAKVAASVSHIKRGYPVYWAITGANDRYAMTLGASRVRLAGDRLTITDTESMAGKKAVVVRQPTRLGGCRAVGHLTMPMPLGEYHFRLYRISGGAAHQVAAARVDSDG